MGKPLDTYRYLRKRLRELGIPSLLGKESSPAASRCRTLRNWRTMMTCPSNHA